MSTPQALAKITGFPITPGDSFLGAGQGRGAVAFGQVGKSKAIVRTAHGFRVGPGQKGSMKVGDRIVCAASLVGEHPPVQCGHGETGIKFKSAAVVTESLSGVFQGIRGPCPVVVAFRGCRGQRDAGAKGGDGILEVSQLIGAEPLVKVGPEILGSELERTLKLLGCLRGQSRAEVGSPQVIVLPGGAGGGIWFVKRADLAQGLGVSSAFAVQSRASSAGRFGLIKESAGFA